MDPAGGARPQPSVHRWTDEEAETYFPQLGIALCVLGPGEPIGIDHREADQEDFLVLGPSEPTRYRDGLLPTVSDP